MTEGAKVPKPGTIRTASHKRHGAKPQRSTSHPRVGHNTVSDFEGARVHISATGSSESLLTPSDILSRLRITSADPAKWMRRTFKKLVCLTWMCAERCARRRHNIRCYWK